MPCILQPPDICCGLLIEADPVRKKMCCQERTQKFGTQMNFTISLNADSRAPIINKSLGLQGRFFLEKLTHMSS